ncbi:hypothetical protein IFR05_009777 [Cadophora sp. M221]|nr:hypothetical protein IFR05_009777 [Cadophora sp. M221]
MARRDLLANTLFGIPRCDHIRGPAKGYTEALEARLAETEEVLLRVLPFVAIEDLSRTLRDKPLNPNTGPSSLQQPSSSKSVLDRKQIVEIWSRSPLRTLADIQRWYDEHTTVLEVMDKASSLRESAEDTNFPILASSSQPNINTTRDDQEPLTMTLTMTTISGAGFGGSGTVDLDLMGNFADDVGGVTRDEDKVAEAFAANTNGTKSAPAPTDFLGTTN